MVPTLRLRVSDKYVVQNDNLDICANDHRQRLRRRRQRPTDDEEDPDLGRLRELWNRPQLRTRGIDNEPVMLFETWYVNGPNFARCSTSRAVALPADVTLWDAALRRVWPDRQHPHWPMRIVPVMPTPHPLQPAAQHGTHGGHLIVLQHDHPEEAGVRLSTYGSPDDDRYAQLVPQTLDLWTTSMVSRSRGTLQSAALSLPRHPRTTGHSEGSSMDGNWWTASWTLSLTTDWWGFCHDAGYDRFSISGESCWTCGGLPYTSSCALSHGQTASEHAIGFTSTSGQGEEFAFNAAAPTFDPAGPPIQAMPEVIQDLHELWLRTAFAWEDEPMSAQIITWFVDQTAPERRACHRPRLVGLYFDVQAWEEHIRRTWDEVALPGHPIFLHVVSPSPPNLAQGIVHGSHHCGAKTPWGTLHESVDCVYDTARRLPEPSIHIALTTTEHIFLEHLIHGLLQGRQPLQRNRPICMMCKICLKGPAGEGVRLSRSVTSSSSSMEHAAPAWLPFTLSSPCARQTHHWLPQDLDCKPTLVYTSSALWGQLLIIPDALDVEEAKMHLIDAAWSGHLSWTKCSKTLARLRDDLTSEDLDARALLSELCQPAAWPFLRESRHGSEDVAPGSLQDWDVQVISLLMDVFLAAFLVQSANIAFCSMLSPGVDDAVMWSGSSTPQVASSALYLWILCRQGLTRRPRPGGCMPSSKDGSRPSKVVLRATLEPRATCAATWRPSGH